MTTQSTTRSRALAQALALACLAMALPALTSAAAAGPSVDKTVVSADGVRIHYLDSGGDAPVALVFLHGWSCDATYWENQVAAFSPAFRVIRVDLAGHGLSGRDRKRFTMQAFGEDVKAVVRAERLSRVVLVAHSMGGDVGLEAARLLPGTVVALIPVDTLEDVDQTLPPGQLDRYLGAMRADFKGWMDPFVRSIFGKDADPKLVDRVAFGMAAAPPEVAIDVFREVFTYDERAGFRAAGVPIVSINSTMFPTNVEGNRTYNPSFSAVIMTGVGHFPMLERPDEFNRLLGQVLQQVVGGGVPARRLVKEVEVSAPVAEVWRVWTTSTGAAEFFAPLARIELRPGGAYEIFFNPSAPAGQRGAEGCKVLSFVPMEMLSFEWSFPPKVPTLRDSGARTWVVVQLAGAGNGTTRVRLTQLGWQDGKDWDAGYAYFDKAWGMVLSSLQQRFTSGPVDWKAK